MSFGKRARDARADKLRSLTVVAAVMASMGMGGLAAPPSAAPTGVSSSEGQAAPQREFVDEQTRKRRTGRTVRNRLSGFKKRSYDGRHARRRLIMLILGRNNTGRQWVRARRGLLKRPEGQILLSVPAWQLTELAERMGLIGGAR